jgi:hypothetical protein
MYDQRLPLPLGGRDPARSQRRPWYAEGRGRLRAVVLLLAVAASVGGALLSMRQPTLSVRMTVYSYDIGNVSLPVEGDGIYASSAGAIVISQTGAVVDAGGATVYRGQTALGACSMAADEKSETCRFRLGNQTLTAEDVRTATGWRRRYQDGSVVDIALPAGTAPVPFPLGR